MKKKRKVLLLGGTGRIGPGIIEEYLKHYRKHYDLIIGFHSRKPKYKDLKTVKIDLNNINSLKKAMNGVNVVVNLAANADQSAGFSEILKPNIIGAYNVFEAARLSKCERVVFASSVHAIKGYPHGHEVSSAEVPKPLNFYGASKVFGEALCNVFSSDYNLSCLAIRIGAYVSNDKAKIICFTRHDYDYVISQRDMGQLIHKCIMAPKKVKFAIFGGISNNKHKRMDLKLAEKLIGYKPKDDAFAVCKAIKKKFKKKVKRLNKK